MDPARHRVTWAGRDVALTVNEFMILEALAQRPGFVKTRDKLMAAAYQDDVYVEDRTIASQIKRLSKKFPSADHSVKTHEKPYSVDHRVQAANQHTLVETTG